MSVRPLIALTTTLAPGGSRGLPRAQLDAQYIAAVEAEGAAALLVTPANGEKAVRALLSVAHGLVLTGGEDVDPARYGQERLPEVFDPNPARDEMEIAAVHEALRRGMPVLGICRGMQLLNVAMGGTLYQDLPTQLAGDVLHEQEAEINARWHQGRVEAGSGLERVFGTAELHINSFHHQAVRDVAPGLRPVAWAEDGVVEAVEGTDHPWLYAVQWHPERGEAHGPEGDPRDPDRRLFWEFVRACREFAEAGSFASV
ncbi:MAG TPA: gamma-glutamyl-gamma-aminobutyrate hydrolase family protein [Longimicrobium sp.]|nr:gamma-glutamyl-gamma-aminobutyrate hydrolase family protein [Longimicrobium sp.]